jgi:lipoteichoic acid synthase
MQNVLGKIAKNDLSIKLFGKLQGFLITNSLLLLTVVFIFLKTLVFIGYASSPTGTYINFYGMPLYIMDFELHLAFIFVLVSMAYIFKGKTQVFILIFINTAFSLFMLFDLMYYRGFQSFLSPYSLSQTSNLENLGSTLISLLRLTDILFFVDVIMLLVLKKKGLYENAGRKLVLFFIFLLFGSGLPIYYHYKYDILEDGVNKRYFYNYYSPLLNISNMSPIGYHIYDTYRYINNSKRLVLNEDEKNQIQNWFKENKELLPTNDYKGMLKGKNLILLQVESLETFLLNQKIEGQEITPSLNKILKNSIYFSQIHEQVSGGNSSDADLIANTSTHPVRDGSTFFRFPDNKYNSLPALMKKLGYYTSAFHPDGGGYWNWMPALQSMDFDKCTDTTGFTVDETIGLGLSDSSYLRQLKDILAKQPQPFYSFAVTLTSHMPFMMPEETKELKLSDNIGKTVLGDYFQSINYTDKHIGKFIEGLNELGILDNTVIVIYGDHTGVHKYYKDKLETIQPREQWWYEDSMRIPLIIYSKDLDQKELETYGGHVDILPTISYLMGIDDGNYINTALGRNLLNTNKNFTILSNGKYIGEYQSEIEKEKAVEALEISDKLLRSNYFK